MSSCNSCGELLVGAKKYCRYCGTIAATPIEEQDYLNKNDKQEIQRTIRLFTDESTTQDAPDFRIYSEKLSKIIADSEPRFTVGIYGDWGTGKTTLMEMIKKEIDRNYYQDNGKVWIKTVWFDAWRYEKEQYSAMIPLLRTIILSLKDAKENTNNIKKKSVLGLLEQKSIKVLDAFVRNTNLSVGGGLSGMTTGASLNINEFMNDYKSEGSFMMGQERVRFYEHITDHIKAELQKIRPSKKDDDMIASDKMMQNERDKIDFRLVIFIDDLDRCSPDRSMEILESIKTFFDIEGIIYVIGVDPKSINSIIRTKYGNDSKIDGMHYLQKIVQLSFHIPLWSSDNLVRIIQNSVNKAILSETDSQQILKYKELIIKATQSNPRDIKRFINSIILAREFYYRDIDLIDDIDKIIAIQAFYFHGTGWVEFLKSIIPYRQRVDFLVHFILLIELKQQEIAGLKDLTNTIEENFQHSKGKVGILSNLSEIYYNNKLVYTTYNKIIEIGDDNLFIFLKIAFKPLLIIDDIEKYLRIVDTAGLTMNKSDTIEINSKKQLEYLRNKKIKEFNDYRKDDKIKIHLPYADLSGLKLNHRVNLNQSLLFYANLTRADLSEANLSEANLSEANLSEANLSEANLSEAKLIEVNLSGADLHKAKLVEANLSEAKLIEVNLSGADLHKAKLVEANLSEAKLIEVNLSGADLNSVYLHKANLTKATLVGANLQKANLSRVDLSEADLSEANLSEAKLIEVNLSGADLHKAKLTITRLTKADLSDADLTKADLSDADLTRANLTGANLTRANLTRANLTRANLIKADLSDADLSNSLLLNLGGSKLEQLKLNEKTSFSGSLVDGNELMKILSSFDVTDLPKLISDKKELEKELSDRGYSSHAIRMIVDNSRCN